MTDDPFVKFTIDTATHSISCGQAHSFGRIGGIPGQSTEVFRTQLKNIFFHEKPQIYTILRYLNLFFNTFCVLGTFFEFFKVLGTFTFLSNCNILS